MEEPVGSLGEEAAKLVETLLANTGYQEHASTCTWCPVCRLVNLVRENPEAITSSMALLLSTAQTFLNNLQQGKPDE